MKILLTCGAGDFIALESYLTTRERTEVTEIYWATRAQKLVAELVPYVFPNVKKHHVVMDKFGGAFEENFCIFSASELGDQLPSDVVDFSIQGLIESTKLGYRKYNGSTFARTQLADVSHLNLPERYFVVHPYSQNARTTNRDMTPEEWVLACRVLRAAKIPLIVVNQGEDTFKLFPGVIDLSNKLTFAESLEVTRRATGFIGASSVFSVLASKNLSENQLFIKGHSDLKDNYAWFYYAPRDGNTFVNTSLLKILPKIGKLYPKKREIKVHTVQGIGDIFWVYQKLAPHFDVIHINVMCVYLTIIEQRAKDFCKLLPKIGSLTFTRVAYEVYTEVAKGKYKLQPILDAYERFCEGDVYVPPSGKLGNLSVGADIFSVPYAVNAWLEEGQNLYYIDPGLEVEKFVDLDDAPVYRSKVPYLCVFVAGAKNDKVWIIDQWIKCIEWVYQEVDAKQIILIGAEWDAPVQTEIQERLESLGHDVVSYVNELDLVDSISVVRGAKFFLGYQSGLNIIAENYDVRQFMLYFNELEPMMYTWCKPENKETKFFAATFNDEVLPGSLSDS